MPRDGSGGYLPPQNSWNPAINGAQALPNDWMAILNDIAATLQASTAADGQTPISGTWNFGGNRIAQVGAPIGQGDVLRWEQLVKGPDITSASTISVPIEGSLFDVTGTTTISSIADAFPGRWCVLRFMGDLQLTHSSALQLPDGANLSVKAGNVGVFQNVDAGVWRCLSWPNGVYRRDNVLGTVQHTGETPTGALIQKGSNANGNFWRFASGLQLCMSFPAQISLSAASLVSVDLIYPAGFDTVLYSWGICNTDLAGWSSDIDRRKAIVGSRFLNNNPARWQGTVSTGDGASFLGSLGSIGYAAIGLRYNP